MSRTPRTDGPAGPDHPYVPDQHDAVPSTGVAGKPVPDAAVVKETTSVTATAGTKATGTELAVVAGNAVLPPQERADGIRAMFGRIAGGYDLMNHVMSGGLDFYWRRILAQRVAERSPSAVLDLATGSGDSALALTKHKAYTRLCVGADFCLPMLRVAQKKGVTPLCVADGLRLPFRSASFDAVTIAFGWRNIVDRTAGYRELRRVLRPGGQLYILELSTPWSTLAPGYFWWLRNIMPLYSALLTKEKDAYQYLAASIQAFPKAPELAKEMEQGGFREVKHWQLSTGIVALHRGSV
ncbi:MAG TPA: ubiquinone/menaquinone biosynthesis methyltransferase [Candidatus Methylacidiphilales bacterium]|nr:ubiquinone/menaquinone biosynthesis methyltransferase [Candidatus Methylacidiphilales bacterium]